MKAGGVAIGRENRLRVIKVLERGVLLDGDSQGDILLPQQQVPEGCQRGDLLDVFVYLDSEDRPIATRTRPLARVGEFAFLKVVSVDYYGAFMDWGLPKDLLVPFREQQTEMEVGRSYLVRVYQDAQSQRIVASSRIDKFLDLERCPCKPGQEVDLIIGPRTDLGYKAIVDQAWWGLLFGNEVFRPLKQGQRLRGYVKQVRSDGKVDLSLYKAGYGKVGALTEQVMAALKAEGGVLALGDKSDPAQISARFGVSKKAYKQAIGSLYKAGLIEIGPLSIRQVDKPEGR